MRRLGLWFVILAVVTAVPCILAGNGPGGGGGQADQPPCDGLANIIADLPFEDVDLGEETDLVWMREEEKLARDVYLAMDGLWGMRVFSNISWSEMNHMTAVLAVLDKYSIADPVGDNPPGVFSDPTLQGLFDPLLSQGSVSLIDALTVGATIEDLDLYDLYEALGQADNQDIRIVYQNLAKGSRNHLRAFVGLLEANGVIYAPQYLTVDDYQAIVTTPHEQGLVDWDGEPIDCAGGGRGGHGRGGHRHGPGMHVRSHNRNQLGNGGNQEVN
jgi:hypothetical protein